MTTCTETAFLLLSLLCIICKQMAAVLPPKKPLIRLGDNHLHKHNVLLRLLLLLLYMSPEGYNKSGRIRQMLAIADDTSSVQRGDCSWSTKTDKTRSEV